MFVHSLSSLVRLRLLAKDAGCCQSSLVPAVGGRDGGGEVGLERKATKPRMCMLLSSNHGFHDGVQPCERTYQRLAGGFWWAPLAAVS
jgi:hypothetical protein